MTSIKKLKNWSDVKSKVKKVTYVLKTKDNGKHKSKLKWKTAYITHGQVGYGKNARVFPVSELVPRFKKKINKKKK